MDRDEKHVGINKKQTPDVPVIHTAFLLCLYKEGAFLSHLHRFCYAIRQSVNGDSSDCQSGWTLHTFQV